jgi:hypothetical protein
MIHVGVMGQQHLNLSTFASSAGRVGKSKLKSSSPDVQNSKKQKLRCTLVNTSDGECDVVLF